MAVIPPNIGQQAQLQPQMQMGYTNPSLLQQQLLQNQLLLQQQLMQQQQPAQPQGGVIDQLGNKVGSALGNKAGDYLGGLFGGDSKGTSTGGSSAGGIWDWITGGSAGAAPASPSLASVSAMGDLGLPPAMPELVSAGIIPEQSGAQMLGGYIGSGLEGLGLGAETAGSIGSTLGYGIPIAAGLYGGYQLANNLMDNKKDPLGGGLSGAATGAAIGSFVPGIGTLAGALVGGLGGSVLGSFGGNKDKDQLARDAVRARMKETGFLGPDEGDYNIQLPDGSMFDIGKDGETKNYNVDFSRAGMGDLVGAVNPLAAIMSGGDAKLNSDYAGYFTNAASGGTGDPYANARALYEKAGLDHSSAYSNVWNLFNAGKLDAAKRDAYLNGVDQVFGANAYAKTGPQAAGNFTAQAPGFGIPQPAAPKPEIQKPAQTGLLAPLPNRSPGGVQMTPGPRPQPIGIAPQQQPVDVNQQLQSLAAIGAKPGVKPQQIIRPLQKPGMTGMLAPLPNQGQGRGPIRLAR